MQELHVTIDPDGADPAVQHLREPLEAQLSSALQRAAEHVAADYHGEGVEAVTERLVALTRESLHPDIAAAWQPDPSELRAAAAVVMKESH